MKISIMSRFQAERYRPEGRAAIISITDADPVFSRRANFAADCYLMVQREEFDDICDDDDPCLTMLSWAQAERIAVFIIRALEHGIDELVIHCEAGVSRSAGVALAACSIVGIDDEFCYEGQRRPNPLVRDRVLQQYHRMIRITEQ